MNVFKNMEVLFIGPSCEHITKYVDDFWKLSKEIRTKLGERGYYLDEYLSNIFEVLARFDLATVGKIVDNICWNILGNCYIICELDTSKEKSEFFHMVKNYIEKHPVNFKHKHTKSKFYAANIIIKYLDILLDKAKHSYTKNMLCNIDYPIPNKMYEKMSDIIGEKYIENLNETMCEAFVFGPIMVSAVQQIAIRGLQMFCYRDPKSSKKLYQLMMGGNL